MKPILIFVLLFIIQGCATGYGKSGFGGGYGEIQLTENGWRVDFDGNGYTRSARTKDFSLLRAAELTLEKGYKFFSVVGSELEINKSQYTTPLRSNTSGSVNSYGGLSSYSQNTTISGGQTYNISKPSSSIYILMFKDRDTNPNAVFNASFLLKSIKKKYDID